MIMEMTMEGKQVQPVQRERGSAPLRDDTFTPDELAEILREANRRQSSHDVASIDEALETARELGIDEKLVLEAATKLRERKERIDVLRTKSRRRLLNLVRYLGTTLFVVLLVAFTAGVPTARLVAFGMSIAAIVMAAQWIRAKFDERFPPDS